MQHLRLLVGKLIEFWPFNEQLGKGKYGSLSPSDYTDQSTKYP